VIVFAVATIESWLNELAFLTQMLAEELVLEDGVLPLVGKILSEAESSRLQVEMKFFLLTFVLTGSLPNKGTSVFEDLKLLCDTRDAIIHFKTERETKEAKGNRLMNSLRSKNVCAPQSDLSWVDRISTQAMAEFSLSVVDSVRASLLEAIQSRKRTLSRDQNSLLILEKLLTY